MAKAVTLKNNDNEDIYPVTSIDLVNGEVPTSKLANGAITTAKITNLAVIVLRRQKLKFIRLEKLQNIC